MVGLDFIKAMLAIGIVLCVILSSAFATENTMEFTGASSSAWYVKYNGGRQQNDPPIEVCSSHSLKITKTFINNYHPLKIVEGDETSSEARQKSAITIGFTSLTGTGEVTLAPNADKTYTYICTAHSGMIGKIKFGVSYCASPTAAKCDTHTCPSGHVLKATASNTDCASATCGDTATDDDTCCEPGYSFGLADINLCPDDSPVNIVWAGEHNIQESNGYDCATNLKSGSGPLEFDGSTSLNGNVGFLGAGSRKNVAANLLSDWKSGCTAAAPCKILALHGGGGSANSMKEDQMNSLATSLGDAFTFVYASIDAPNTPETWWDDPESKSDPTTEEDHASAMVAALDTIRINQGPFWGIVGYSQGAAAVPVYLSNVPDGTFQAAAMFAGYLTTTHVGLLNKVNREYPFGDIPALIWLSTVDTIIAPALSHELKSKFTTPTLIEDASAGHVVPKSGHPTFNAVANWFRDTAAATPRVRYFRCTQHCSGARLRVTCNRESPNAKCNTHTCPSGHVLKETSENIPCAGTTCASPTDDDTCCESGYSFGLADIILCPDDSPANIVWAGEHNIQESVSHDCDSAEISGPLEFDGSHTHTSGDEQFLGAGTRKNITADLLSDWNSTRYFRCSQHCGGARLSVTCNRSKPLGYCAADYAALGRVYDPSVPECPHGAAPIHVSDTKVSSLNGHTFMCRCGKCGEIFESMVQIREACVDGELTAVPGCNGVSTQTASSCDDCADGLYYIPNHNICTGCTVNGAIITADVAEILNAPNSGYPSVELCPSTPEVSAASCDTFDCPALFSSKSSASSIDCAAEVCTQQSDLYTCCESTDELYGRSDNGENDCNDDNCDGNGNKCVDANGKVTTKCKCLKDPYFKDFRHVIAEVGDYCDEEGFFDEKEDDTFAVGQTRDRVLFGRTENCDKRCQRLFEQPRWDEYHTLLDQYKSRPCRAEGKTGPKCTNVSSRRLSNPTPNLDAPIKRGVNVACHDDDGLTEVQKKGFECYGCSKCKTLIDEDPYGPIKVKYSTPSQPTLPDHGGCQPFCHKAFEGTGGVLYEQWFCGGIDKDGNQRPRGTYADGYPGCFVDIPGSTDPPNRKNYVCNHWRKCTGCRACIDAGEDTDIFPEGFGPSKPKDIYGDGSRIAGECRYYCKARFKFEPTGLGKPYYDKWNDGLDGGPVGSKVLLGLTTDTGFAGLNKSTAPADLCTWKGCGGCKACKAWASAADNDVILGSKTGETYGSKYGSNDGFRFKEPDKDYANEMNHRNHRNMIGGCSVKCRVMFDDPSEDVRDLCTMDECDGCDPCISPDKYLSKDTKYAKFDRNNGRMHLDDREKFGEESDGRALDIKGTASSNTWDRTPTCPGFPKCYAYEGVCETRYCRNCDECLNVDESARNKYKKAKPVFKR